MVVEDDLYLGARERRGEIEKEREERERERRIIIASERKLKKGEREINASIICIRKIFHS